MEHPYTANTMGELFSKEVVRLYGIPKSIFSVTGPIFVSNSWKKLF
jgi:hypothetical protein